MNEVYFVSRMGRPKSSGEGRRVKMRIPSEWVDVFDGYSPEQLSELMVRALASITPGIELGDRMVSVVRPASPVSNTICRQFRARIPKALAEDMASQSPTARGDRWADGVMAERSLPILLKAVEQLCPLESPSWIVDKDGVTVVWGEWSATADTQVGALLLLLAEVIPNG